MKLLPKIGGPRSSTRTVTNTPVSQSTEFSSSLVRHSASRIILGNASWNPDAYAYKGNAFRTASTRALQIITSIVPMHLLVLERNSLFEGPHENASRAKRDERVRIERGLDFLNYNFSRCKYFRLI